MSAIAWQNVSASKLANAIRDLDPRARCGVGIAPETVRQALLAEFDAVSGHRPGDEKTGKRNDEEATALA